MFVWLSDLLNSIDVYVCCVPVVWWRSFYVRQTRVLLSQLSDGRVYVVCVCPTV